MTTITIERSLLEQALNALTYQGTMGPTRRQRRAAAVADLRAALAAPAAASATTSIEDHTLERLLDAWDTTVLPKHRDGAMQEWMEALRHEYRTCPDNSITGRVASLDFGLAPALDIAAPATAPDELARLQWAIKDALEQLQRGDLADAASTLSVAAMKGTP